MFKERAQGLVDRWNLLSNLIDNWLYTQKKPDGKKVKEWRDDLGMTRCEIGQHEKDCREFLEFLKDISQEQEYANDEVTEDEFYKFWDMVSKIRKKYCKMIEDLIEAVKIYRDSGIVQIASKNKGGESDGAK